MLELRKYLAHHGAMIKTAEHTVGRLAWFDDRNCAGIADTVEAVSDFATQADTDPYYLAVCQGCVSVELCPGASTTTVKIAQGHQDLLSVPEEG